MVIGFRLRHEKSQYALLPASSYGMLFWLGLPVFSEVLKRFDADTFWAMPDQPLAGLVSL